MLRGCCTLHAIADPNKMQQSSCYLAQREATFDNWGVKCHCRVHRSKCLSLLCIQIFVLKQLHCQFMTRCSTLMLFAKNYSSILLHIEHIYKC